jgi:hypothetical protein
MITVRPGSARGVAEHGWLSSRHSFSFADYYDPAHRGFSVLRVINEDRVAPAAGFGTHGHRDMEILSYVLEGALEHADSMGNRRVLSAGELQLMSAGTGVRHSEFNHSAVEPVHFLQIWLLPSARGGAPRYQEARFPEPSAEEPLRVVVSPDGRGGSLVVKQDVCVLAGRLTGGARFEHRLDPGRAAWVQVARGRAHVSGHALSAGDGLSLTEEPSVVLVAEADAELLVFDLPAP